MDLGSLNQSLGIVDNETCQIIISDNGKGIPSENISKIFDEYFTCGKRSGNGLGLFYANKKVKEWGGSIDVQSEVSQGTTINLTLRSASSSKSFQEPERLGRIN